VLTCALSQQPAQAAAAPGKRAAAEAAPQVVKGARLAPRRGAPWQAEAMRRVALARPRRLTPPPAARPPRRAVVVYEELVDEFGFRYKRRRREPVPEARSGAASLESSTRRRARA
jgi:hypothetical protein